MSRLAISFSLACAVGIGAMGGWGLREWQYRTRGEIADVEKWAQSVPIPGLTIPLPLPLPPLNAATATPGPILPPGAEPTEAAPAKWVTADLVLALNDGTMTGEFRGNGRERMRLMMVNRTMNSVRLSIPAGQVFKGVHGSVVVARPALFEFAPGESRLEEIATLAIASMNRVEESAYMPSEDREARLNELLQLLADHPEIPIPTAQTAALSILENLPVNSIAKFAGTEEEVPQPWDTSAFRVDTSDVIGALALLRKMGIPDQQVVMAIDPQTRIEAMLDPLARAQAMHYYGITPDREWAYWRGELLEGNPRTRHYALHGIGRYFPEVGLKMLPTWVRETRTTPAFRKTAVIALTETRRPEALDILKALQIELADDLELSMAIAEAATYMEAAIARAERRSGRRVGFRVDYGEVPPAPQPLPVADPLFALIDEVLEEENEEDEEHPAEMAEVTGDGL